jgi:hypothetical protein
MGSSVPTWERIMNKKVKLNTMQRILLNDYRNQQRKKLRGRVTVAFDRYCPKCGHWIDIALQEK